MAASITIEEEGGTYVQAPRHPHNGYFAGDFASERWQQPLRPAAFRWTAAPTSR